MLKVEYNNFDVFSGVAPTPLVSRNVSTIDLNHRWGLLDSITLEGFITGECCASGSVFTSVVGNSTVRELEKYTNGFVLHLDSPSGFNIGEKVNLNNLYNYENQIWTINQVDGDKILLGNSGAAIINQEIYTEKPCINLLGDINSEAGNCSFLDISNKQDLLIQRFSQQFQRLKIFNDDPSDNFTIYDSPYAIVRNINFPDSKMVGLLPFSIDVDLYKNEFFSGTYGVLDPVNEVSFSENDDGTVSVTRVISAKGFNTNNNATNALSNAINYVNSYTGWSNNLITPNFVDSPNEIILVRQSKETNRLEGSYSVTEEYTYDPKCPVSGCGILRYDLDFSSGDNGAFVSIDGNILGGKNCDIDDLRGIYSNQDFYQIANNYYQKYALAGQLFSIANTVNAAESSERTEITFNLNYADRVEQDPYLIDRFSVNEDCIEGKACASLQGTIASIDGCIDDRWQKVNDFYDNLDIVAEINQRLDDFGKTDVILESEPKVKSITRDPQNATIAFNIQLCENKDEEVECLEDLNYTMNFTPALPKFAEKICVDGKGSRCIQEVGANSRSIYSLSGTTKISECCTLEEGKNALLLKINEISALYFSGACKVLTENTIEEGDTNGKKTLSFTFSWTAEGNPVLTGDKVSGSV